MTQMVHRVIDFDNLDYETLAVDFKVSVDKAKTLVKMLKSCFDSQGNFSKSTFGRIMPALERYERRIFDFLWHNLKESLHQNDRTAFLDSLQLLVDRLKQPQNSISVLLEDLYQNPSVIRFADRKAFMLGNRLLETLDAEEEQNHLIGVQDLLALEREAYIFLGLVGRYHQQIGAAECP